MSKKTQDITITTVGFDKDKQRIYDEICGAALVNLFTLSKNSDTIAIYNFDPKNEEHLFLLGVAKSLAGVKDKKVCLDVSKFQLWKLNRGIDKDCRIIRMNCKEMIFGIDPNQLLNFMRPEAEKLLGKEFSFGDIYRRYYKRKKDE